MFLFIFIYLSLFINCFHEIDKCFVLLFLLNHTYKRLYIQKDFTKDYNLGDMFALKSDTHLIEAVEEDNLESMELESDEDSLKHIQADDEIEINSEEDNMLEEEDDSYEWLGTEVPTTENDFFIKIDDDEVWEEKVEKEEKDLVTRLWEEHLFTKRHNERVMTRRYKDYEFQKRYEKFLDEYFYEDDQETHRLQHFQYDKKEEETEKPIEWLILEPLKTYKTYITKETVNGNSNADEGDLSMTTPTILTMNTVSNITNTVPTPNIEIPKPTSVWKVEPVKIVPLSFEPSSPPPVTLSPLQNYRRPSSLTPSHQSHKSHHTQQSHYKGQDKRKDRRDKRPRESNPTNPTISNQSQQQLMVSVAVTDTKYPRLCKHGRYCKRKNSGEKCDMAHTILEWDPTCQRGVKCNRGKNCLYWHGKYENSVETKEEYLSRMIHKAPNNYFSGITSYEKVYCHHGNSQSGTNRESR